MLSNIQILVNTTTDTPANDANVFGATVSLREAINFASVSFDYCTVSFAPSLISSGPAKIALTQGTLRISSSMTITGLGADQLTIDGNNSTRIFTLFGSAGNAITISGLTLTGGAGGAIFNNERLTLSNCTIYKNTSQSGGGILNSYAGTLTSTNNTIANNTAVQGDGGGIYNLGTMVSTKDTIDHNTAAQGAGGGIVNAGTLVSTNDTIDNNTAIYGGGIVNDYTWTSTNDTFFQNAADIGGGVYSDGASWSSLNTIIAGSTTGGDVYNLSQINATATLIGDSSLFGTTGIINATGGAASIFGKNTLSSNGGPTQTVALAAPTTTNRAIGAAKSLGNVTADNGGTLLSVDNVTFIAAGDYLQIGTEIVLVQNVTPGTRTMTVARAQYGTNQTSLVGNPIYLATDATGAVRSSQDLGARASQHLLTVNTNADPGSTAPILPPGIMTLRNAITTANADVFPAGNMTGDTINFDASLAGNMITLNGSELLISNSMTIAGLGAGQLTIDGNNASRIFDLNGPSNNTVTITGLTLQHGNGKGRFQSGFGGAIFNTETLILSNDTIDNNTANGNGGGISIDNSGTLTSTNDTIDNNTANGNGGGISVDHDGSLTSTNDTIAYNAATNDGGGISDYGNRSLTIANDTIDHNTAKRSGGGLFNNAALTSTNNTINYNTAGTFGGGIENQRTLTSTNDTIAYNAATNDGGGVDNNGTLTTTNDTISNNTANRSGGGISNGRTLVSTNDTIYQNSAQVGGGINNRGSWNSLNTIVAGSTTGGDVVNFNSVNAMATLIGDSSLARTPGIINAPGGASSIFGTNTLSNNGGPTQTVALAVTATNPAIGAATSLGQVATDNGGTSLSVDNITFIAAGVYLQIGTEIVLVTQVAPGTGKSGTLNVERAQYGTTQTSLVGNPIFLATDETGAFRNGSNDLGALASQHLLIVNTTADTPASDANIQGPTVSLREAINFVNNVSNVAEPFPITFASSLTASGPATITLNGTELLITNSMMILGLGADQLTIDGNNASRIFDLNGSNKNTVSITGLTLQHGNGKGRFQSGFGGAIFNNETLILSNDTIVNNTANGNGGGVSIDGNGTLTSTSVTIVNNTANGNGGGVSIDHDGSLISTNDTIDHNGARGNGGGISIDGNGTLTSTNDAINNNSAGGNGGGVSINHNGALTSTNDTIVNNTATSNGGGVYNNSRLTTTNDTILGNTAVSGGGVYNANSYSSNGDTVDYNSASVNGGGIGNGGTLTITGSTVDYNTANQNGGGLYSSGLVASTGNTIANNSTAASGGGIYASGVMTSTNDTIAKNTAAKNGGGIVNAGTLTTRNVTIYGNSAAGGGGVYNNGGSNVAVWNSLNTIVAGSVSGNDVFQFGTIHATAMLIDDSLLRAPGITNVSGGPTSIFGTNTLADNGGPTQTVKLAVGSPAIGAAKALGNVIANGDLGTTLKVDTTTFIVPGDQLRIGTEIVLVQKVSAGLLTVARAQAGTTKMSLNGQPIILAYDQRGVARSINDIGAVEILTPTITITQNYVYTGTPIQAVATVTANGSTVSDIAPTITYYMPGLSVPLSSAPTRAGTYTVVAMFAGNDIFTSQTTSTTITIGKATPVVSVKDPGGTYNGSPFPATALVQGVFGSSNASLENVTPTLAYYVGATATGTSSTTAPIKAGTYTVVATFAGSWDYSAAQSSPTTFTIGKATPVVSVTNFGGTYNGLPFPATGSVTGVANAVLGTPSFKYYLSTDLNFSSPLSAAPSNVGSYVVVASFAADGNYSDASQTTGFSITAASVTLQIGNVTQIAGTAENLATDLGTTISTGINNEKFNIQYSSAGDITTALIGTYPITGQLSDGTAKLSNYIVTLLPGTLNVVRKTITVNSTRDAAGTGKMTLRQAIIQANGDLNADQIVFDPSLSGSIVLNQGELAITHSMLIVGPGANKLTISGNKVSRIFDINGPSMTANSLLCVTVSGLTMTGGNGAASTNNGYGGAIYNHGQLTLTNDTITANTSSGYGGGLYNVGTVNSSGNTFSSNVSSFGGGLNNDAGGIFRSTNDTFWGNTAYYGGAIKNVGLITTTDDTIAANNALNYGGGLFVAGTWNSMNSIVAGNLVSNRTPSEIYVDTSAVSNKGQVNASNTLIGDASSSGGIKNGVNGNIVGKTTKSIFVTDTTGKPVLANNGGSTLTVALAANSPAIGTSAALTTVVTAPSTPNGTSFTVSNPTYLAVGDLLKVGTEIVKVTSISGYTVTVLRDQGGTANTMTSTTPITLATNQLGRTRVTNNLGAL